MQGKRVAVFRPWAEGRDSLETFDTPNGKMQVMMADPFYSFTQSAIATDKDWYTFPHSSDVEITLTFSFSESERAALQAGTPEPVHIVCDRYHYTDCDAEIHLLRLDTIPLTQGWKTVARLHTPDEPGPYYLRFCLRSGWMPAYINSHLIRMDIE